MEKAKKIKIYLGTLYLLIVFIFLWFFFRKFSLNDLVTYDFIKSNRDYIFKVKQNNYFLTIFLFIFFTIIWVLLLGFGSPIFLLGSFIFGKWLGTLIVTFSLTIGATILYLFASYFFKDLIIEKFLKKFKLKLLLLLKSKSFWYPKQSAHVTKSHNGLISTLIPLSLHFFKYSFAISNEEICDLNIFFSLNI